jgi:Fe-S-cluster containining protein
MTAIEKLEALYATLPNVNCKKKCQDCCGPILISKMEASRLEAKRGFIRTDSVFKAAKELWLPSPAVIESAYIGIKNDDFPNNMDCPFLDPVLGNCTVYRIRPLVCRLWGAIDHPLMRCPHGCKPDRELTNEEQRSLHLKIIAIQQEWEEENGNNHRPEKR